MKCSSLLLVLLAGSFGVACGDDSAGSDGDGSGGASSTSAASTTGGATTAETASTSGATTSTGAGPTCTQAREDALGPIDQVSEADVAVLDDAGGVVTLFIDASAGGISEQANNPWIYVDLAARARADVTDVTADADASWDLALKRPVLRSNSGDGGYAGAGGSVRLDEPFDAVTSADAAAAFETEAWFDADCNLLTDVTGAIATTFDGWYDYKNTVVTPGAGTWLVRGGDGTSVFKLEVLDYYANPDGSHGQAGGRYLVRVADVTP